ncbi:MAG: type II toxin-antitoxin system VapC family toxin [Streptosporangiaceae bacterium]|nr:type II toxin-antitoxin system VapC family toxin [Streptosporangiaceae bacterium]MBV9855387.1 type II toxin-antitoxin system VapC family toxin [Streptosporangiaceae bacterium]
MSYLLDTNIVSELRKRAPDRNVLAWYDGVPPGELFLSVLTLGEIRLGIERLRRKDAAQAAALERWLTGLHTTYRDRVVAIDAAIADAWARLSVPDPIPVIDGLLAATASARNWTLVTRNTADFARCGVRLLNPFEPGSARALSRGR